MFSRGLPPAPKPTKAQSDELAADEAWNAVGTHRSKTMALSADDERSLTADWQKVGRDKAAIAAAKNPPPKDKYEGMTPDQIADAKLKERYEAQEAEKRAKAFSDRIDREVGDIISRKVLSRRGYYA